MFNGYNDTPLISYEFSQERVEKKHENVPKWTSYGHDTGLQPAQTQPNNRHPEFWTGKSNFLGIPNVVKCNCTGCYPSSEKQSYQGDTARHRPWLPRTYSVPLNGSNEPCKLPACQWDNVLSNQGPCYADTGLSYVQENGGKYSYYKHHQSSRLAESNQPGVITSVKNADYGKKSKGEMPPRGQESPVQNGTRQPVFCNPAYGLPKRVDGRNYCDAIEKYSNVASYSVDQHVPRLPVVEPFAKAVPSNLSQSRVPSAGYRSVKENMPQPYVDLGYGEARKICAEDVNCEQRNEPFSTGQLQTSVHPDYSHFNPELETQKLFFENTRHPDYYSRNSFPDVIKRNNQTMDGRKDCAVHQMNEIIMSEQHYNVPRSKHQDLGSANPSCDAFYSKEFEKTRPENHLQANSACFQRNDDAKNENMNVHSRLPPSALLFNDPRFADRTQNSFTCQSNPVAYRNYIRPEYPYQGYNAQPRYEYPAGLPRNDLNQYRAPQQIQNCDQLSSQQGTGFHYDPHLNLNPNKTQQLCRGKNPSPVQPEQQQPLENRNPAYLEAIRSEDLNKNGTSKISPLRLLRKKKFINVPQEPTPPSTLDAVPGLDVRKFWSTWAEEEEENVAPTQMVVLDCQNIDPEQAKLLHLYETDSVRSIHLDASNTVIKNTDFVKESAEKAVEEVKTCEQLVNEPKVEEQAGPKNGAEIMEGAETEKTKESNVLSVSELESKTELPETVSQKAASNKPLKKAKSSQEKGKKKTETMDKWTEKKFDFLKRAEESKAAEILRHEEEKKKIFETRLSLQQGVKKFEKPQESIKNVPERVTLFDENSQSDSPEDPNGNVDQLPTSEYRRNKFLDYSEKKVLLDGEEKMEKNEIEDGSFIFDKPSEIKKEENECPEWQTDKLFPPLNPNCKEEAGFEMDDILKKMSEIHFQNPEVKLENGLDHSKKLKSGRKLKKRKSDHLTEDDERTDKLTVETVTKPTIKFSIQKSHDLKISFKVLNSSKEYSDEDLGVEGAEHEGKAEENSKNSTELITLKYKSIKRDGDRRQTSDLKKSRRTFSRSKQTPKTPVLKIKKSRYLPQEEKDPLADDEDVSEKRSPSDGFQVKETMDSAKIKLTFKRHKGNFEREYKINSNNIEKVSDVESIRDDDNDEHRMTSKDRIRKKSRRENKDEIFAEAGVENFQNYPEPTSDVENSSPRETPHFESTQEEDSGNSSASRDSYAEDESCDFPSVEFPEFPSDSRLAVETSENGENFLEERENPKSKWNEKDDKCGPDLVEFALSHVINSEGGNELGGKRDEFPQLGRNPSSDVNFERLTPDEVVSPGESDEKATNFQQEGIREISLDFIRSTKSQEIKSNHNSGKTVESDTVNGESDAEELKEKPSVSVDRIAISKTEESSSTLKPKNDEEEEMICTTSEITNIAIVDSQNDSMTPAGDSEQASVLPLLDLEDDSCLKPSISGVRDSIVNKDETYGILAQETTEPREEVTPTDPDANNSCENLDQSVEKMSGMFPEISGDVENPLESEKPNESSHHCPETGFDLLLEKSADRMDENIFECDYLNPETVEENSDNVERSFFENSSLLPSPKDDLELLPNDTCPKDNFLLSKNTILESVKPPTNWDAQSIFSDCRTSSGRSSDPENTSQDTNSLSLDAENTVSICLNASTNLDICRKENTDENKKDLERQQIVAEVSRNVSSPNTSEMVQLTCEHLDNDSGCAECSFPTEEVNQSRENCTEMSVDKDCESDLPSNPDAELEDGEIVDCDDEPEAVLEEKEKNTNQSPGPPKMERKNVDFVARKIERRHSVHREKLGEQRKTQTWSKRKFSKAKSCPPELMPAESLLPKQETPQNIPVECIPLPLGPPPHGSCFDFIKYKGFNKTQTEIFSPEVKEKSNESSTSKQGEQKEILQDAISGQSPAKPSSDSSQSVCEVPQLGIFQRSSKIKFSFLKKSKFSKIGLKTFQDTQPEVPSHVQNSETEAAGEVEKSKEMVRDFEMNEKRKPVVAKECQSEKVPKSDVSDEVKEGEKPDVPEEMKEVKKPVPEDVKSDANPVGLSCEDLDESVEAIDSMSDFIRDEFYECEDIPTSEDLTNGEDPEIEKVNDDKFRNIMQNCLDNAKKFLNVGNLKLFSCSVDDLLELDCQDGSESSLGENEPEKPTNHISRDVLLTSCGDTNDDLGLSENVQPADISMDFVPSFCSDVCPEILPVDNWPYLEEEVPSSPTKSRPEDTDLIPNLETALSGHSPDGSFSNKNGIERRLRKRVVSETSFKRFRRKSLLSDCETFRMCSKIGPQRRKTIDSFTGASYGRETGDIKNDLIRLKNEADGAESKSLKCRLSLEKIANKHGIGLKNERTSQDSENGGRVKGLDYRSPSWQPKVMLFRISKHELRKVLKSSKSHKRFPSKSSDGSTKRKIPGDVGNQVAYEIKKRRSEPEIENLYVKPVHELGDPTGEKETPNEEKLIDLSTLDSIKGSLTTADPEGRKRKKCRFRNLHTKRKPEPDTTKDIISCARGASPTEQTLVDAEIAFAEIFKNCERVSNQMKNTQTISVKDKDHRSKKKSSSEHNSSESRSHSSSRNEKRSQNEAETTRHERSDEEWKSGKHHEKKHDHRDRRREKGEGKEDSKHEDKHRDSEKRKHGRHGSGHDSNKHQRKRSPSGSKHSKMESEVRSLERCTSERREKRHQESREEAPWVCEVCGFSDAGERIAHIKSHPFHCQSCHLAFKTEAHFTRHLTKKHKDIRNQHHCLLCELSFDTEEEYQRHLETREHRHLESVEKNTINTLFTLLTGAPCPVFGLVEMRPEWLPNQAGTVHFYHQATPLSLALQYLKMHHDLSSVSLSPSSSSAVHPN